MPGVVEANWAADLEVGQWANDDVGQMKPAQPTGCAVIPAKAGTQYDPNPPKAD